MKCTRCKQEKEVRLYERKTKLVYLCDECSKEIIKVWLLGMPEEWLNEK